MNLSGKFSGMKVTHFSMKFTSMKWQTSVLHSNIALE